MLPALAGFATKALLPSAKKISKDKLLNRKESSAIQKVDSESDDAKAPIVKKKTISTSLLLPPTQIKEPPSTAEAKGEVKGGKLSSIFTKINETLKGIVDALKNREEVQREESNNKKQQANVDKKKEREEQLEKKAKKKSVKTKTPKDKFNLMNFFGNILLGSIALAIFENLEKIIEFFKNIYKQVTEFLEKLEEFFAPLWNAFKWIAGKGTKLIGQLLGIPKEDLDDKDILKNLNKITDQIPFLKNLFEGINNTIESLRSGRGLDSEQSDGVTGGSSSYTPGTIPQSVSQDTEFTQGVTNLAKKLNVPEDYLYAVMGFETGGTFDPAKKNIAGSGATGLIQFMPETAKGLGTTTEALSKMSRIEQLTYVEKYLSNKGIEGGSLSDVYMAVLFPAAVGKPEDFVLFGEGAMSGFTGKAYEQNKGLDLNKDGSITKAEAASKVTEYLPQGVTPSQSAPAQISEQAKQIQDTGTYTVAGVTYDAKTGAPAQISEQAKQIQDTETYTVAGVTYDVKTGAPVVQAQVSTTQPAPPVVQAQVSTTQPAPPVSASVPQIMQQAEYEIPGGTPSSTILPIPIGGGSGSMMMGGGGTKVVPIGMSKQALLNSYYQTQLIGFLYKQG